MCKLRKLPVFWFQDLHSKEWACRRDGCDGIVQYIEDEYGGLSGGGDYEVWRCPECLCRWYVELPD